MNRVRAAAAAAATIGFLILIPAAPASADTYPVVHIATPTPTPTLTSSSVNIGGSATIDANALKPNDITGVTIRTARLTIKPPEAGPGCSGNLCGATYGSASTPFSFQADLPYNGTYAADVTVTANEYLALNLAPTSRQVMARVTFKVGAAPAPPQGVKAVANGDRTVTVSWNRNIEPDIVGYQVQRQDSSGPRSPLIAQGSPLTWTDTATTQNGGQYSYVVYVARNGADGAGGTPISAASPAVHVDVPAPPPPTTSADGSLPPLIQATPTTAGNGTAGGPGAPSLDLSGFLSKAGAPAKLVSPGPALPRLVTPGSPEAPDTGFQPTLPFPLPAGRNGNAGAGPKGANGSLGGQPASSTGTTRRTILLPFAAGLFLCVVGVQVRWFNNRFGGDGTDPSLLPVEDVPTGGGDVLPARAPATRPVTAEEASTPNVAPLDDQNVLVTW